MPSAPQSATQAPVLIAGATGFVGRHLEPALRAAGYRVLCASRDPQRAASRWPQCEWVRLDVEEPASVRALPRCSALFYLVHQMAGGRDYPAREAAAARALREAALSAGASRIVYLGGVAPSGTASPHLRSRLRTGALLREGKVTAIELRAAMIVGEGSASWQIVRDLAARLPAMLLPRWLNNRSSPVAIDDVVAALLWALRDAEPASAHYDVPGPQVCTHRELIERVAGVLGKHPAMVEVPVVTPRLSSYWIALVTRTRLDLAQELVQGLQSDLLPTGESVWTRLSWHTPVPIEVSARRALADEGYATMPAPPALARLAALGREFARMGVA